MLSPKVSDAQGHVTISHGVREYWEAGFLQMYHFEDSDTPDTITYIGNHSFQQSALETISIPSSVIDIGYAAFFALLASVTSDSVTD